jgi:hypothetical protein
MIAIRYFAGGFRAIIFLTPSIPKNNKFYPYLANRRHHDFLGELAFDKSNHQGWILN